MKEDFLHYIWFWTKFNLKDLQCTAGDPVIIQHPGIRNNNSGPDFESVRLKINNMEWTGFVEIHVRSSDWVHHKHHLDKAYNKVILHVVWEHDHDVVREDGSLLPTLELRDRVHPDIISRYRNLLSLEPPIPCSSLLSQVDPIHISLMIESSCIQRLEAKSQFLKSILIKNKGHWEKTFIQALAINFGFKKNKESFLKLFQLIPFKVLQKCSFEIVSLEALLFGQAGFLDGKPTGIYHRELKMVHQHLIQKHKLKQGMDVSAWKFLRLRPANFPTLRIAQFASLLNNHPKLTAIVLEAQSLNEYQSLFSVTQSEFWLQHYHFNKKSKRRIGNLGTLSIQNILINSIAPYLYLYGNYHGDSHYIDKSVWLLEQIKAEKNRIITLWTETGVKAKNALETQGLLEMYHSFCSPKKCLDCKIGINLLK